MDGMPFLQGNAEFGPLNPTRALTKFVTPLLQASQPGDILLSVRDR